MMSVNVDDNTVIFSIDGESVTVDVREGWKQERLKFRNFLSSDWFCPGCGKQRLIREPSDGDYYLGPLFFCLDCKDFMHIVY